MVHGLTNACLPPPLSFSANLDFKSTTRQPGDCLLQDATWFGTETKKL